jgi:tRNA(Ile)-lysidine synthase
MDYFDSYPIPDALKKPIIRLLALLNRKPLRLLLALSGGPDSTALLYALMALQKQEDFALGVAHVDHRWREESAEQADALLKKLKLWGIPFFLETLDPLSMQGNLEQSCRVLRLQFFAEVCRDKGYDAVLMAHHRDDQAETVLKRVLEGASFQALSAMEEITELEGMIIIRPWLGVPKDFILHFLSENKIGFFSDATNLDARFLRGRMRSRLFPFVEKEFGKSIREPLVRLSQECQELNAFFREKWREVFSDEKPWCSYLDCKTFTHPFELRWAVREWFRRLKIDVSCSIVETIVSLLMSNLSDRRVRIQRVEIAIDRKQLFLIPEVRNQPAVSLCTASQWGSWQVNVELYNGSQKEERGWRAAFSGRACAFLPEGDFELGL